MYVLVSAPPLKPLNIATLNFANSFIRSKGGICDDVPSTGVYYCVVLCLCHLLLYIAMCQ